MRNYIIGGLIAVAVAGPAVAVGMNRDATITRAEVVEKVKERFAAADTNKDGFVTKAEIDAGRADRRAEWLAKRGERRDAMFARLDTDKNGQISKAEFDAVRPPEGGRPDGGKDGPGGMRGHRGDHGGPGGPGGMRGAMIGRWMERADTNKDGKLSLADATTTALAMFDKADTNKDGKVTPDERQAARQAMRAEWQAKRG